MTLIGRGDGRVGIIHCPKTASPDPPDDLTSYEMPIREAVSGAIQLANTKKIALVVIDRDNIWKTDWGDLWRYQEEGNERRTTGRRQVNKFIAFEGRSSDHQHAACNT